MKAAQAVEPGESSMERSITHSTFVIERSYPVAADRVFAAFSDPAKKRRWFFDDESSKVEEFEMDFRVGGREKKSFHVPAGFTCTNDTVYRDLVPNRRIVFAYTMSVGEQRISSSQATVELVPTEKGTDLIFTEQAAFFEGADGPQIRQQGWNTLFERLAKQLAS